MPDSLQEKAIRCPHCGERLHIILDTSAGDQDYIEDCQICCQPMQVTYACRDNEILYLHVCGDS